MWTTSIRPTCNIIKTLPPDDQGVWPILFRMTYKWSWTLSLADQTFWIVQVNPSHLSLVTCHCSNADLQLVIKTCNLMTICKLSSEVTWFSHADLQVKLQLTLSLVDQTFWLVQVKLVNWWSRCVTYSYILNSMQVNLIPATWWTNCAWPVFSGWPASEADLCQWMIRVFDLLFSWPDLHFADCWSRCLTCSLIMTCRWSWSLSKDG